MASKKPSFVQSVAAMIIAFSCCREARYISRKFMQFLMEPFSSSKFLAKIPLVHSCLVRFCTRAARSGTYPLWTLKWSIMHDSRHTDIPPPPQNTNYFSFFLKAGAIPDELICHALPHVLCKKQYRTLTRLGSWWTASNAAKN